MPECPKCGDDMTKRRGKFGGFWGCNSYPKCTGILNDKASSGLKFKTEKAIRSTVGPNWIASSYQTDILNVFNQRDEHIIIQAGAGCAKTETIRWLAYQQTRYNPSNCIFLAFGSKNAKELDAKVPPEFEVLTTHTFCKRTIQNVFKISKKPLLGNDKSWRIFNKLVTPSDESFTLGKHVIALVHKAKAWALLPEQTIEINELIERYSIDVPVGEETTVVKLTAEILKESLPKHNEKNDIDFDDMLWWTAVVPQIRNALPKFEVVFGDEVQDFNRCQLIIMRHLAQSARLVLVGDPYQSLFGFRGADDESFENLETMAKDTPTGAILLPLPINYRCTRAVIEWANQWFPELQAHENARQGNPVSTEKMYHELFDLIKLGDAILCRVNAPLVSTAFRLAKKGTSVHIVGRYSVGSEIVDLIETLASSKRGQWGETTQVSDILVRLDCWLDSQAAKFKDSAYGAMAMDKCQDIADCIKVLADMANTKAELIKTIDKLFIDDSLVKDYQTKCVILATGHRAKGLEFPNVFVICPEKLPHPLAKTERELKQERNCAGVIATRSKGNLFYLNGKPSDEQEAA